MLRWLALMALAGCARGGMQTVTIGGAFGERTGVVVAVELAAVFHERFDPPGTAAELERRHRPRSYLGIAASAGTGMLAQADGVTGFATAGLDYLPFVYDSGAHVGFGGHVAYGAGAHDGVFAVAPRLWFAVPVSRVAGAPLTVGLMLRCQLGVEDAFGCGPQLVLSRAAF